MQERLREYLDRLYIEGEAFDAKEPDRRRRRRNLEPESAKFLWILSVAANAKDILEIGTSNGYSTLWLADAARLIGGRVTSIDIDSAAQSQARDHLRSNELERYVELIPGDAGPHLAGSASDSMDLLFLDAERTEYPSWWPHPLRVVRPGGMLIIDNAAFHQEEVKPFAELLAERSEVACQLVEIGKGELVCVKVHPSE